MLHADAHVGLTRSPTNPSRLRETSAAFLFLFLLLLPFSSAARPGADVAASLTTTIFQAESEESTDVQTATRGHHRRTQAECYGTYSRRRAPHCHMYHSFAYGKLGLHHLEPRKLLLSQSDYLRNVTTSDELERRRGHGGFVITRMNWWHVGGLVSNSTYRHFSLDHHGNRVNTKIATDAFDHVEDHDAHIHRLASHKSAPEQSWRHANEVYRRALWEEEKNDEAQKCYPRRGAGTRVFVIDTGCRSTHEQLRGRVLTFASPGSHYENGDDDHGHGTHVAATIAGRDFGIARRAKITCIKALSDKNTGTSTDVISAIDHVIRLKQRVGLGGGPREAFLMSISLGVRAPATYDALDRAVSRAARAGIVPIVAAGNAGGEACGFTPARAAGAITVGALAGRRLASFSNRGRCVAVAAPGVAVRSAYHASDRAYARSSGTSMAAPHVSGLAALILGERPAYRPRDVLREIRGDAAAAVEGIPIATIRRTCPREDRPPALGQHLM